MSTQSFNGKTESYEKGRPVISKEALDYLYSIIPANAVFADIGAGTGKFTSLIAKKGNIIYAVEPNDEMRDIISAKLQMYSNVKILETCAERTGIPGHSIDVIVAVTALHWFDLVAFKKECHRILKPNGMVIAIYNSRETELHKEKNGTIAQTKTDIFFMGKCDVVEFSNPHYYSYDKFMDYHFSHSSFPARNDPNYASALDELNSVFENKSVDGNYYFDFITVMYIAKNFVVRFPLCETVVESE